MKWTDIEFFKSSEFDSPDLPGSGEDMNLGFVKKLDFIRNQVKRPLQITSGMRSLIHNEDVGGKPDSAHTQGLAADIYCDNSTFRFDLIEAALRFGIKRIEIAERHVHLDASLTLPQNIIDYTKLA